MSGAKMAPYPDWLSATLASDATEGRGVLPPWIRTLWPDARVVGPAFVVQASQDDNAAVVQATATPPPPGCVLVVGGQSTSRSATIGGLMALEMRNLDVAALVTDGLVRDAQEIRQLALPIWCRGVTPTASAKRGPGAVGGNLLIGGALVRDGDLVIADDDGVVIWPAADYQQLLVRARAKLDSDNVRLTRLRAAPSDAGK
jgi:4-hydroxy-4-methyl-2-oxoglutarate aldolase